MKVFILLFSLLISPQIFAGASVVCGQSQLSVINSTQKNYPYFSVSVVSPEYQEIFSFHQTKMFLRVMCLQDSQNEEMILVNHTCGGSACPAYSVSLIRVSDGKMVLSEPDVISDRLGTNVEEAETILGRPLPEFQCPYPEDYERFCHGNELFVVAGQDLF